MHQCIYIYKERECEIYIYIYIERAGLGYTQVDLEPNPIKSSTIRFCTFCIWICVFHFLEIQYLFLTFSAFWSVQKVQIRWWETWPYLAPNPLECSQVHLYIYIYIYIYKGFDLGFNLTWGWRTHMHGDLRLPKTACNSKNQRN